MERAKYLSQANFAKQQSNSLVDINLAAPGCLGLCYSAESCPGREVRPPIDLSRLVFERMDLWETRSS